MNHPKRSSRLASRLAPKCAVALLATLPLMAQACNTEPLIGDICTFAFDWCPRGYLPANGATVSIRDYTALFGVIGFSYGGDNVNNFALPDLRGRTVVGTGTGTGLAPITNRQQVGQQVLTLNAAQAPLMTHTHTPNVVPAVTHHTVTIPATAGNNFGVTAALPANTNVAGVPTPPGGNAYLTNVSARNSSTNAAATITGPYSAANPGDASVLPASTIALEVSGATPAVTTTVTTMTTANIVIADSKPQVQTQVSTQSPALVLNACIATAGIYPNRP